MLTHFFSNQTKRFQQGTALLIVLIIAGIGTYLLTSSHAATPYASINADSGTLANGAVKQACTGANDVNCVVFNGSSGTGKPGTTMTTKMIGINGTYTDSSINFLTDTQSLGAQWERVPVWSEVPPDQTGTGETPACQLGNTAECGVKGVVDLLTSYKIHLFPDLTDYGVSWVDPGGCSTGGTQQQCNTACATPNYAGQCTGRDGWVQAAVWFATTYAQGGTYWKGKTDYGSPVIEMGNEAWNSHYSWPDQGWLQPGDYAQMLEQAANAVTAATNGRIKLLASVIPLYTTSSGATDDWSQDMQAAVPNLESYLGGVAYHPYGDIEYPPEEASLDICSHSPCSPYLNQQYPSNINAIHADWPDMPVYMTEIGQKAASTTGGNGQVGYADQCNAMNQYFNDFKANSWEAALIWYNQNDYQAYIPPSQNGDNGWALIDNTGFRKPAWYAYQAQATNLPQYNCNSG